MSTAMSKLVWSRVTRWMIAPVVALGVLAPRPALAQPSDKWEVTFAPLYLCAAELNGQMTALSTTIPVFLDFGDAADHLSGAFSFHFEARKGRWGGLSDLNFLRLSSDSEFTIPGGTPSLPQRTIAGECKPSFHFRSGFPASS